MAKNQKKLSDFFGIMSPAKKHQTDAETRKRTFTEKWLEKSVGLKPMMSTSKCGANYAEHNTSVFCIRTKNFSHPVFLKAQEQQRAHKMVQAFSGAKSSRPLDMLLS